MECARAIISGFRISDLFPSLHRIARPIGPVDLFAYTVASAMLCHYICLNFASDGALRALYTREQSRLY